MAVNVLTVGELETNCCFLYEEPAKTVIIDPGAEPEKIAEYLNDNRLTPIAIINTHGHYDHIIGNSYLQKKYEIPIYYPKEDEYLLLLQKQLFAVADFQIDFAYDDNLKIDELDIKIIKTPGHSKGSSSLLYKNMLFPGDTLFAGGYLGRTDLWGGSDIEIQNSLKMLLELPDETVVYPGHGPQTTIREEKVFHV